MSIVVVIYRGFHVKADLVLAFLTTLRQNITAMRHTGALNLARNIQQIAEGEDICARDIGVVTPLEKVSTNDILAKLYSSYPTNHHKQKNYATQFRIPMLVSNK